MAEVTLDVTGAILAGGESRRFGSVKALAPWNGKTLVETVLDVVSDIFASNLLIVKDPEPFRFAERPSLRLVRDLLREPHSLGGLWSSLSHAATEHVFVCGCDMPFLQKGLIERLLEARHGYDAVIPVWRGTAQPLCGIYSKSCQGVVGCLIGDRRLKIQELFGLVRTRFLLESEVKAADPAGLSFVDLDTPEDYERARRGPSC